MLLKYGAKPGEVRSQLSSRRVPEGLDHDAHRLVLFQKPVDELRFCREIFLDSREQDFLFDLEMQIEMLVEKAGDIERLPVQIMRPETKQSLGPLLKSSREQKPVMMVPREHYKCRVPFHEIERRVC